MCRKTCFKITVSQAQKSWEPLLYRDEVKLGALDSNSILAKIEDVSNVFPIALPLIDRRWFFFDDNLSPLLPPLSRRAIAILHLIYQLVWNRFHYTGIFKHRSWQLFLSAGLTAFLHWLAGQISLKKATWRLKIGSAGCPLLF